MACAGRGHRHSAWRVVVLLACTPGLPDALLPLYWRPRCVSLATPCPPASASARPAASSRSEALCLLCMLGCLAETASLSLLLLRVTGDGVSAAEACSTGAHEPSISRLAASERANPAKAPAVNVHISPCQLQPHCLSATRSRPLGASQGRPLHLSFGFFVLRSSRFAAYCASHRFLLSSASVIRLRPLPSASSHCRPRSGLPLGSPRRTKSQRLADAALLASHFPAFPAWYAERHCQRPRLDACACLLGTAFAALGLSQSPMRASSRSQEKGVRTLNRARRVCLSFALR